MKLNVSLLLLTLCMLPIVQLSAQSSGFHQHSTWNTLLSRHVNSSGEVNYKGLVEDQNTLDKYLEELKANPIQASWTDNQKMAYWINAYNAFTIKLIIDHYPVKSIKDIHNGNPWDVKWIKLGEQTYSLNNIENDILRREYKEPRIHFAVNCAAVSCPPLYNKAWTADNLDDLFYTRTVKFINNNKYNQINSSVAQISKIFKWYRSDFGNFIGFINKHSRGKIGMNTKVTYNEYNWDLNSQ